MWSGNSFQVLCHFSRIFCKKKFKEICMLILSCFDSFAITNPRKSALFQKFHFPIEVVINSLKTKKGLGIFSRSYFAEFFHKKFTFVIWCKLAIHYQTVVYVPRYSIKRFCFVLSYFMTSWNSRFQHVKTWLSQERKEHLTWNLKQFSWFQKCYFLGLKT